MPHIVLHAPPPQAKPYKNNPEIKAVTSLISAYQNDDIVEFKKILSAHRCVWKRCKMCDKITLLNRSLHTTHHIHAHIPHTPSHNFPHHIHAHTHTYKHHTHPHNTHMHTYTHTTSHTPFLPQSCHHGGPVHQRVHRGAPQEHKDTSPHQADQTLHTCEDILCLPGNLLCLPLVAIFDPLLPQELGIDAAEVEALLVSCILDNSINGRIDQVNQFMELDQEPQGGAR